MRIADRTAWGYHGHRKYQESWIFPLVALETRPVCPAFCLHHHGDAPVADPQQKPTLDDSPGGFFSQHPDSHPFLGGVQSATTLASVGSMADRDPAGWVSALVRNAPIGTSLVSGIGVG